MRKIISLALLGILSLSLFGCYEKNDLYKELDTEKAEKVALDYMNEKYDKDFYVVSSNKYKEMSLEWVREYLKKPEKTAASS